MVINGFRRVVLLHAPAAQHRDAVAHAHRLGLVMGHKDGGNAQHGGQFRQLVPHFLPEQRIQRGKRFVKQNAPWLNGDGTGKGDALLLTAGQLVRIALFKVLQMHGAQRVAHSALQILCGARRPNATFLNTVMCGQSAKS